VGFKGHTKRKTACWHRKPTRNHVLWCNFGGGRLRHVIVRVLFLHNTRLHRKSQTSARCVLPASVGPSLRRMSRHVGGLYDVPGYVARMMGIEDADSEEDVRLPHHGSYVASVASSFPSTFVHSTAARGTHTNPFAGASSSAGSGSSASHVHRLMRHRSDGRIVGRPGEPDDVRLMRQRLQAMEAARTEPVTRQAPVGPPPGTLLRVFVGGIRV
jgi:hypothetical protein